MLQELNSIQLAKILKTDKCTRNHFIGIFSRDLIPLKFKYPACFIMNTQSSKKPGEHWLAFYYDKNGVCEFFDSYGLHPKFYRLVNYLNRTSKKWSCHVKQHQSLFSKSRRYYAFIFLIFRCRNISMKDIILNKKLLNSIF